MQVLTEGAGTVLEALSHPKVLLEALAVRQAKPPPELLQEGETKCLSFCCAEAHAKDWGKN